MGKPGRPGLTYPPGNPVPDQKEKTVQDMFSSIACRYDLNNSLLSLGWHRAWKRRAVRIAHMQPGMTALDLCTGTADIAILLAGPPPKTPDPKYTVPTTPVSSPEVRRSIIGPGQVIAVDLNERMLALGRGKIAGHSLTHRITCLRGHAEQLQFKDQSFDLVTVGFGIRNLEHILEAFREIYRVLKPGGRVICLEFSRPRSRLFRTLYDLYSFKVLPLIGTAVSGDQTGVYRYLPASIRSFPDQEGLKEIMRSAGFGKVDYVNLTGGIVAIHTGWR